MSPSVRRKPAASSSSKPGVRIVTATATGFCPGPAARISSGSSPTTRSARYSSSEPRTATIRVVVTWRVGGFWAAIAAKSRWRGSGRADEDTVAVVDVPAERLLFSRPPRREPAAAPVACLHTLPRRKNDFHDADVCPDLTVDERDRAAVQRAELRRPDRLVGDREGSDGEVEPDSPGGAGDGHRE